MFRAATFVMFLLLAGGNARAADNVTIYRCVDAKGKLTLRDSPCVKGQQQQQKRTMQRPKDPPASRNVSNARKQPASRPMPAQSEVRYVVVNAPRPLYECTRPDGSRYTSDNDDGNRRWMPLWTLDYPVYRERLALGDRIGAPPPGADAGMRPDLRADRGYGAFQGGGTWVQDDCYPLPQEEVCAQLSDRRSQLRRRYFNAMPSERETLAVEERGLNARLRADCGIN